MITRGKKVRIKNVNDADYIDGSNDLHLFICIDVLVDLGSTQPTETHPP